MDNDTQMSVFILSFTWTLTYKVSVYSLYVNIDAQNECLYSLIYVEIDTQSECVYSIICGD